MNEALRACITNDTKRIIISNPKKKSELYHKIAINQLEDGYQIEQFTKTQVFHENIPAEQVCNKVAQILMNSYRQIDIWNSQYEYHILLNKNGEPTIKKKMIGEAQKNRPDTATQILAKSHNREKSYLIKEGQIIPPLVDMGIFTKDGKVVKSMYDKYKQINRFIEILDDEAKMLVKERPINIIDFGCGKSYLTFIVYYYFQYILKQPVNIVGLDLKEQVIHNCNLAAQKYGYDNLHFEVGDIQGYQADFPVDIVITLHACDTATDYALYHAIRWNTELILSVPCCQHEVNKQIENDDYHMLMRYGIVKERFSALLTDACRANLLHYCGYKTQIMEFVDLANTPKNLLLRAKRTRLPKKDREMYLKEAKQCMESFSVKPALYRLLEKDYIKSE